MPLIHRIALHIELVEPSQQKDAWMLGSDQSSPQLGPSCRADVANPQAVRIFI
jgi:hypothetical protein